MGYKNTPCNSLLFVIGVGRSGTTLLHALLSTSNQVYTIQETSFIRRFGFEVSLLDLQSDPKYLRNKQLYDSFPGHSKLENVYHELLKKNTMVVDKDPGLITFIKGIRKKFPKAFFLHIYRDPVAVIESKKKAAWSSGRFFLYYLCVHAIQLRSAQKSRGKSGFIEISYENLIDNTFREMNNLGNILGVDFDTHVLENYGEFSSVKIFSDETQWKKNVHGGILKDNINFKSKQSKYEKYILYKIVSMTGILDYENKKPELNLIPRFLLDSLSHAIVLFADLYLLFFSDKLGVKKT